VVEDNDADCSLVLAGWAPIDSSSRFDRSQSADLSNFESDAAAHDIVQIEKRL
jgi:hypothetical protein